MVFTRANHAFRTPPNVSLHSVDALHLANAEGQHDSAVLARAAFWRRYDVDRLPKDDPKLWARVAEILLE